MFTFFRFPLFHLPVGKAVAVQTNTGEATRIRSGASLGQSCGCSRERERERESRGARTTREAREAEQTADTPGTRASSHRKGFQGLPSRHPHSVTRGWRDPWGEQLLITAQLVGDADTAS